MREYLVRIKIKPKNSQTISELNLDNQGSIDPKEKK